MPIDAELARDFSLGEGFLNIAHAGGQAAAFVGSEGDEGFAVKVDVTEQREHHLRVGAPRFPFYLIYCPQPVFMFLSKLISDLLVCLRIVKQS